MQFSVVVPLYNKSDYIVDTLRAVLDQDYHDFEVLVIDDGSTDDGGNRARMMGDPRIRVITQANAGVSAARNLGIASAQGQWVAFLDADDLWRPEYLSIQAATIAAHPQVDVCATGFYSSANLSNWIASGHPLAPDVTATVLITDLPEVWMRRMTFFTSSVVVRTERLRSMQPCFAVGEVEGEDLDLWFRLGEISAIAWVPVPAAAYRLAASSSLSANHKLETHPPYWERMRRRAMSGALNADQAASARRFVAQQEISRARASLMSGNRDAAIRWLRHSSRDGLRIRRWWITLAMAVVPSRWVNSWQSWRMRAGAMRS